MTELEDYWKQWTGYINTLTDWYQDQSGLVKRFIKFGGWTFIQFWIIRAPMTMLFTNLFPATISLILLSFPGYLLASFTSGTLLAIVGFVLSEKWIWKREKDEV